MTLDPEASVVVLATVLACAPGGVGRSGGPIGTFPGSVAAAQACLRRSGRRPVAR